MKRENRKTDEYLYGSTRIRALESKLIGREKILRLLESGYEDSCLNILEDYGIHPIRDEETGAFKREETLLKRLKTIYADATESAEQAKFLSLWLYPYDCNNIKAAIKCKQRGVDPADMLFDFGTVPTQDILDAVDTGNYEKLPPVFAEAAKEAFETFVKTANPQWVDLILDKACYNGMLSAAKESGVEFAVRLVRRKIDLTNLTVCLRLLRMQAGKTGLNMLRSAMLEGGFLSEEYLTDLFTEGEEMLWDRLQYSEYSKFALQAGGSKATLTQIETASDNAFMETVAQAKLIPYGEEPLIAYVLAGEYEVRNLRIILSGFSIGLPIETVRERIRDSYV